MASFRGRMANQVVKAIGVKRRLGALAAVDQDPDALARRLARLRRTDRRRPPWTVRRRWDVEERDVAGSRLYLMSKKGAPVPTRVLLYLHGGGYLFGPFGTEWAAARRIAEGAQCDFAMFMYPRAPEHDVSATLQATQAAYAVLAARYGASNVIPVGTSAGGGLAIALMASVRDAGETLPSFAVLLSPGVDMTLEQDVAHLEGSDVMVPAEHVRSAGRIYAGEMGADHPSVSPTFGSLEGLPAMYIFVGGAEILRPSLEVFSERAEAAGTEVHLIMGEGEQHTWPIAPTPEGRDARDEIIAILRSR